MSNVYPSYRYKHISRVPCQKGPICHALAWRVGPFWQDTIDVPCYLAVLDHQQAQCWLQSCLFALQWFCVMTHRLDIIFQHASRGISKLLGALKVIIFHRWVRWNEYGPVTMIVPVSGHQVRCIHCVQMGTINKEIVFLWIKTFCIEYILWGIPTIESTFDVANMVQTTIVKNVPINDDALLNIQAC